jgi:hypothetical protein
VIAWAPPGAAFLADPWTNQCRQREIDFTDQEQSQHQQLSTGFSATRLEHPSKDPTHNYV